MPDKLFTKGPLREVQQKVRRVKRILLRGKTECSTEAIIKARLSQDTFLEFELFVFHFQVFVFCGSVSVFMKTKYFGQRHNSK